MIAMRLPWGCCSIAAVLMWDPCGIYVESPVALLGSAVILLWYCRGLAVLFPVVFLWYCWGITVTLLWCCCGNALVLRLCCCGIHVESCGIDVEFPMALLGHCCEIAGDYWDIIMNL